MPKIPSPRRLLVFAILLAIPWTLAAQERRDYLIIVGSTTVAPFGAQVVERFVAENEVATPMVQPTGTGGGMMLFCSGTDLLDPDVTYSSRPIRGAEIDRCVENGIKDIVEIKIGYDGIVLAQATDAPRMSLTRRDIYLALAETVPGPDDDGVFMDNPNKTWQDVREDLPDLPIKVWGPGKGSGTLYVFSRLAMEEGCRTFESTKALEEDDVWSYKHTCRSIREDGVYVEIGENDDFTADRLDADRSAMAILSYGVVDEHEIDIRGVAIDGIKPSYTNIAEGSYLIARPLYVYVKKASVGVHPGIPELLAELTSEEAWGPGGYLRRDGLVAMDDDERSKYREIASNLTPMTIH